jgi:hypothetical protein
MPRLRRPGGRLTVSRTAPRPQSRPPAQNPAAPAQRESRSRRRAVLAITAAAGAGALSAWAAGLFSAAARPGDSQPVSPGLATAAVTRQYLAATMPVAATVGYAGSYRVWGAGGGTLTWLPAAGQVIRPGHVLFRRDNGFPVVLLSGHVPAWRTLRLGLTGGDVAQLNHDLVTLGDASRTEVGALGWDYFSWATAAGVAELQSALRVSPASGSLPLGAVVFEPRALRIRQVSGRLGGPADGQVLTATSDLQVVSVSLDVSEQSEVKAGDKVTVTLPDGQTTPGAVSSVGRVATTSGSGGSPATTIPVEVTLTDASAAGALDQAPVTVHITTASSPGQVLAVPVTALVAQAPERYVVEVVSRNGTRRWVPVTAGIFDDSSGLVQVTGPLRAGQRVVVAGS